MPLAINDEPLGPYNEELLNLSALSYDRKALSTITLNLEKKLAKSISNAESLKRLYTVAAPTLNRHRRLPDVQRSSTVHGFSSGESGDYRKNLEVLKCLTVIVYICQNGSHAFLQWAKQVCDTLIYPIGRLSFHPKTSNAIYLKAELIIKFCKDDMELKSARHSIDQIRSELKPGLAHRWVS
ncbi:hypothetical protein METBIDRAFT_12437 [Metschnikowia bicuspidata var. bicuspidata NRRL YB-4993]|uniref:ENTH domain-containing protein n=1 Tax=Metschnikowia bicuspidata var. bicuspidata NRRL YB-4993 TaxID=869754 RepID=A0A1A0H8J1_9ASCO|nr:hypothetical protein METBIDRAFT_12437 [Metschnikowia bicuspidata var. bicuspidata NRRL YB-4993]OBA20434.1 hypothetical protein METBIDRAFT_12437 [Metschnikowia bicuspidata var. bicuspidata NRRL YB-4993]